jgi:hypothetical protein
MDNQGIKDLIEKEIELELNLKRNNPEPKVIVKINYLRERLEHLKGRLFYFIDKES